MKIYEAGRKRKPHKKSGVSVKITGTVNSFAQIFSCSIDIAAQVSLSASARHRNGNNSAGTTFAY